MSDTTELTELPWLLAIVQSIAVGVVVLARDFRVEVWNTVMENRSGLPPAKARNRSFFSLFPEVDEDWFRRKVEGVMTLGTPSFTIWEQRPYLLRFKNYQPITGLEDFMYQNTTLLPLKGIDGSIAQVCLIIYDVTAVAVNRRQLQAANAELQRLSSTDRLTGLYNRGHWEEMLQLDYARHRRYESQAALVMFDIDHFKAINDTFGHAVGDEVLIAAADTIRDWAATLEGKGEHLAFRLGGEEFLVIARGVTDTAIAEGADDLRMMIAKLEDRFSERPGIRISASIGLSPWLFGESIDDALMRADLACYEAKRTGRNRVRRAA